MLNRQGTKLLVFEEFQVDKSLPKYKFEGDKQIEMSQGNSFSINSVGGSWMSSDGQTDVISVKKDSFKEWFGRKLKSWSDNLTGNKPKKDNGFKKPTLTVEGFFKSLKNTKTQLNKLDQRLEGYEAMMSQADELGQVALKEKLVKQIGVIRSESQLYANNMVKVVLEDQVVTFYKECEKGLRLDWIKNFTRVIPQKFVDIKKRLDDLKVFDNYVILHFDANEEAYSMTEEEIEKEKDPILFGVIKDSRKLYYIGDWVDEYCNLTLDDFFDKYGKEAILKNNISAEIDIQEKS